jgi:hypothetical protein
MSLLEFTKWRRKIDNDIHCSSIDQIVISLKKIMTGMLDCEGCVEREFRVSSRICFSLKLSKTHNCILVLFNKQNKIKKGGALKRPPEENAFNNLSSREIVSFLKEIFTEIFIYSNFYQFNGDDNHIVESSLKSECEKETFVKIKILRRGMPLALTDYQVRPSKNAN